MFIKTLTICFKSHLLAVYSSNSKELDCNKNKNIYKGESENELRYYTFLLNAAFGGGMEVIYEKINVTIT